MAVIKMLGLLFVVSLVVTIYQIIKEAFAPTIPAENWANKELIYKEITELSEKEFSKNLVNGKYKLNK